MNEEAAVPLLIMLRYHGLGEVAVRAELVEGNSLRYRWIRRAAPRAEAVIEQQSDAAVRRRFVERWSATRV